MVLERCCEYSKGQGHWRDSAPQSRMEAGLGHCSGWEAGLNDIIKQSKAKLWPATGIKIHLPLLLSRGKACLPLQEIPV
jgi:hypothetical protein